MKMNMLLKAGFAKMLATAVIMVGSFLAGGCTSQFRKALVPGLFDGLNAVADQYLGDWCDGGNMIIDSLLNAVEQTIYPEG